jgi:hypothetical protein
MLGAARAWWLSIVAGVLAICLVPSAQASIARGCPTRDLQLSSVRHNLTPTVTYWDLALRDVGSESCHLRGYPMVHLMGPNARPLADRFRRVMTRVRIVTLRPGRAAFFTVLYVPGVRCGVDRHYAFGLTVVPPGGGAGKSLTRRKFAVCDTSAGGRPNVSPLRSRLNSL